MGGVEDFASLTDEERRALRGSKFAPLPSRPSSSSSSSTALGRVQPSRLAHPGGPLTTNKAAALAKFLERKLQQPDGLNSIKPELLELAVKNAKEAVTSGGTSGRIVRHVNSFDDPEISEEDQNITDTTGGQKLKKKKGKSRKIAKKAISKKKKKQKKALDL